MYRKVSKVVINILHVLFVFTAIGLSYRAAWMVLQKNYNAMTEVDFMILAAVLVVNSVIAMEVGNGKDRQSESGVSK